MRRLLSIAVLALALASANAARAQGAQSNANTPKLALHKTELWLAVAEPKPSVADIDAGMGVASALEERLTMLNTEVGAVTSRRRTLLVQAAALRQKAAELKTAPRGETGIRRAGSDAKIAEPQYEVMLRLSEEEHGLMDVTGRVRGVVDIIETSTAADTKQKQKAATLATKTIKLFQLHAAIMMTVVAASQPTSS